MKRSNTELRRATDVLESAAILFGADPPTGDGHYRILRRGTANQVLDVTGVSTANGARIQTWSWVGGRNQQWRVEYIAPGQWRMVARHSGKCLHVPGASTANSVQLQQYTCNSTLAQAFTLTAV